LVKVEEVQQGICLRLLQSHWRCVLDWDEYQCELQEKYLEDGPVADCSPWRDEETTTLKMLVQLLGVTWQMCSYVSFYWASRVLQNLLKTTMTPLLFSTFEVTTQAFYRASLSYAIVNLKPIVPGRTPSESLWFNHVEPYAPPQPDVLVIPNRPVPRLSDLDGTHKFCSSLPIYEFFVDNELSCLMRSIKRVGSIVEKVYGADGLTVACQVLKLTIVLAWSLIPLQDGKAAGQTVPHVHFHLMPRKFRDDPFAEDNDKVYPALDNNEGALASDLSGSTTKTNRVHEQLYVDADENRPPRTLKEMEAEATFLKTFFKEWFYYQESPMNVIQFLLHT
jgi:bis(5'-adenosyl)-triphosphatase